MMRFKLYYFILFLASLQFACEETHLILENEGEQLVNIVAPSVISFFPDETQPISFEVDVTDNDAVSVEGFRAFLNLKLADGRQSQEQELVLAGSTFTRSRSQLFNQFPIGGQPINVLDLVEGDVWEIRYVINLSDGRTLVPSRKTIIRYECVFDLASTYFTNTDLEFGDGEGGQSGSLEGFQTTVAFNAISGNRRRFQINDLSFGLYGIYQLPAPVGFIDVDCTTISGENSLVRTIGGQQVNITFFHSGIFVPDNRTMVIEWENTEGDRGTTILSLEEFE
jgi:hypothetical protein